MVFQQVCLQGLVSVRRGVEQQLPLLAGALLTEVPEHAGDRADHLRVTSETRRDGGPGERDGSITSRGCR